jgi:hypothetical protein
MRSSPLMRAAIISLSSISPSLTPASKPPSTRFASASSITTSTRISG